MVPRIIFIKWKKYTMLGFCSSWDLYSKNFAISRFSTRGSPLKYQPYLKLARKVILAFVWTSIIQEYIPMKIVMKQKLFSWFLWKWAFWTFYEWTVVEVRIWLLCIWYKWTKKNIYLLIRRLWKFFCSTRIWRYALHSIRFSFI